MRGRHKSKSQHQHVPEYDTDFLMKIDKALLDSLTQKAKDGAYEPIGEEDILCL